MTPKEAVEKIRSLFMEPQNPPSPALNPEPAKMEAKEYVLEGGQKVLVSELEIGGMVQLVDDAGTTSPAPAGEHKLADGTTITVGENGLITAVSVPATEPAPPPPGEDMAAKFAATQVEIESLKQNFQSQIAKMEQEYAAINDRIKSIAEIFSAVIGTPSADPVNPPKHNFHSVESKEEKLKRLSDRIASLKK